MQNATTTSNFGRKCLALLYFRRFTQLATVKIAPTLTRSQKVR
jgi:hypothetical protein